jgi:hypothetical protein
LNLLRKVILSVVVLLVSWLWRDQWWLMAVTTAVGWLSIWVPALRRLVWTCCVVLVTVLLAFFIWRQGGASHYTNWILSMLLTLTLVGAVLELGQSSQANHD